MARAMSRQAGARSRSLRRCGAVRKQNRIGKKVIVYGNMDLDAAKDVHRDLGPEGVVYQIFGSTREDVEAMLKWLEGN